MMWAIIRNPRLRYLLLLLVIAKAFMGGELIGSMALANPVIKIGLLEEPRTLTTPIAQKKEWKGLVDQARRAEQPLARLLNHKVEKPVGTGPFVLKEWRKGAYVFLERNKHFFWSR